MLMRARKPGAWGFPLAFVAVVCWSLPARSPAITFSFTNANLLVIQDSTNPPTPALPYPSTNLVTGLTGMVVVKATVTLQGLTHGFPSDIEMLLVGPGGQESLLMAQVGGQNKFSVTNLNVTLDDQAANYLPVYTNLQSGTFKPTNGYFFLDGTTNLLGDLPPPAPTGNSNAVASLSMFQGTDPTGAWRLFVVDDAAPNAGALSNGWSLHLSVAVPLAVRRTQTTVVLSWTNAVQGCTLQATPNLSLGWTNVLPAPVVVAGRYTVTNPIAGATLYYRLAK